MRATVNPGLTGGFPYDVRVAPRPVVNWDSPLILTTREENGKLIMPKEWRDDDDEGEDAY